MYHIRKFSTHILIALILFTLSFSALAHPGDTDGSGGHTNHSTGEYHYHHGYSAHQHYDRNGDGIADCPYNFKDKTGQTSDTSSGGDSNAVLSFVSFIFCVGIIAFFVYYYFH